MSTPRVISPPAVEVDALGGDADATTPSPALVDRACNGRGGAMFARGLVHKSDADKVLKYNLG